MKKLVLLSFLFIAFGYSNLFAQSVNDTPLKDIKTEYIQIVGTSKLMSNKVTIEIDFGQENKYWTAKDTQVKDSTGKLMIFNSMIDALNFFADAYEFQSAYTITISNQSVYHFLMRKKKEPIKNTETIQ